MFRNVEHVRILSLYQVCLNFRSTKGADSLLFSAFFPFTWNSIDNTLTWRLITWGKQAKNQVAGSGQDEEFPFPKQLETYQLSDSSFETLEKNVKCCECYIHTWFLDMALVWDMETDFLSCFNTWLPTNPFLPRVGALFCLPCTTHRLFHDSLSPFVELYGIIRSRIWVLVGKSLEKQTTTKQIYCSTTKKKK